MKTIVIEINNHVVSCTCDGVRIESIVECKAHFSKNKSATVRKIRYAVDDDGSIFELKKIN